jgi:hypothetical protein
MKSQSMWTLQIVLAAKNPLNFIDGSTTVVDVVM